MQKIYSYYSYIPSTIKTKLFENRLYFNSFFYPRKLHNYIVQAKTPLPDRLENYNYLNRTPLNEIFNPNFLDSIDTKMPLDILRKRYNAASNSFTSELNRMLFLDWKFTLADNDLRKVNKMCDIAGIEVQYPLLCDDVLSVSTTVPPSLKLNGNKLRYFFKYAMRDLLPKEIVKKHKHGFGLPFGPWLNKSTHLKDRIYDNLERFSHRNITNEKFMATIIAQHNEHASYYGSFIWVIVALEEWLSHNDINVS